MKRFLTALAAIMLTATLVWAVEYFPPPHDESGEIGGTAGQAWSVVRTKTVELNDVEYTFPAADGSNGHVLKTNGSGTLSWGADSGSATAWDDLTVPDANESLDMTDYYTTWDFGDTDHDMFTLEFTGAFGDYSGMVLEQKTGNPTNGTLFELKLADTDPDFVSMATGGVEKVNIADDGTITLSAGSLALTAGDATIGGNLSVTGSWSVDAIAAATATQTLTLDGDTTGGVTIGATSTGNVTIGDDLVMSDTYNVTIGEGSLTIDNDQTNETALTITSDATTSGGAINITSAATTTNGKVISVTADDLTTGDLLYLDTTASGLTTGNYIHCYDGAATDFEVGLYGATLIAGNASTDVLTITAGDVEMTAGDLDLNNGNLMVDTVQDLASNITRNYAGAGTGPVVTIKDDHTSAANVALLVESDGTGNGTALQISHDGDYPAVDIDAGAARTGDVIDILMTNMLAERALNVTGAITGANGEGVIEVHATGNIADGASLLRLDTDTGTPAGTTAGFAINIDDDSGAQANAYAVLINSANNEALHVATGAVKIAEMALLDGGADIGEDIDVDFDANDEEVTISNSAEYGADGAQVTINNTDADVAGANMYLLRLQYTDDGQANADYLVCEDNAGDDQLAINASGDIVMGGASGTGGRLQQSWEDLTVESGGTAASVDVIVTYITTNGDGDEDAVTLADGTKGDTKKFVTVVEGAGGDSYKITPAHMNGGTKITFDGAVGDGCIMEFDGTSWNVVGNNGGTIS